jgi:hypothetical protein
MRRMLFGIATALVSLAAFAAAPPSGGAPVTIQNVPLPVSIVKIPEDMDQRRPIDVQIVGPAVDLDQVRGAFVNRPCYATIADQGGSGFVDCSPQSPTIQGAPVLVRMVTFMPASYSAPPNMDVAGLACQATVFLSKNGGATYSRIAEASWSPPNFAPTYVTLPVPIVFQPGTPFAAKVRLWIDNGPSDAGCRVRAIVWATQP